MSNPDGLPVVVPYGYRVGRWEVLHPLASGAFSSVYAARNTAVAGPGSADDATEADGDAYDGEPATAALKFLATGTRTPRQLRHLQELSERELRLHEALRRPHLVRMYEACTVDDPEHPELDGCGVLALERAESSLDVLLRLNALTSPKRALPGADRLLVQICTGLAQLHESGWVHGDLKPGNVLLFADGAVRLSDFNLAAELEGTHAYTPAFSTLDYTPPELFWPETGARGIRTRQTADVWAFGVLSHLLLTGSLPFPGATPALRRDAALRYASGHEPLPLPARLPDMWRDLVADCLAPTHTARAPHTSALLLERAKSAAGPSGEAVVPGAGAGEAGGTGPRRRTWLRTVLLTTTALLCGLGLGLGWSLTRPPAASGDYGYIRCPENNVCFFSERNGNGDMCSYRGSDGDWAKGDGCAWTRRKPVSSLFNNGDLKNPYYKVEFYLRPHYKARVGCTSINQQGNLTGTYRVRSHRWVRDC
ncbi:serine/threonine-protein kinase [Streptomyces xiaopingdaonensis]|uniref:serine/threonine-protein kinase n=1 Tax=Streptomyces xiaopingdaonensis TaxID=1565415 RepID=UPI0002E807F0|nr:serine/threonine-protein kinase [Streptomyces xiaopingdaonensis]